MFRLRIFFFLSFFLSQWFVSFQGCWAAAPQLLRLLLRCFSGLLLHVARGDPTVKWKMHPCYFSCVYSQLRCADKIVWFPNSTRLRMRLLNCLPEDMPCGWATCSTCSGGFSFAQRAAAPVEIMEAGYTTYCFISPDATCRVGYYRCKFFIYKSSVEVFFFSHAALRAPFL